MAYLYLLHHISFLTFTCISLTTHYLRYCYVGFCDEGNLDTSTPSNRLCYIVDGSLSIFYSSVGTNTTTTTSYVSSRVNTTLQDIFESKELFSGLPPNILGSSLITPITNTPPTYSISGGIARKIVSPTTVASFCAGLFFTILLLHVYFSKRYHSRNNGTECRNKRSDGDSSTPRQSFRHIRILSPRGGQKYVDLDDNVLPDSSGTTMASSLQASAFNFEPVLAATTSTESGSVSLFAVPPNDTTAQPLQSPASSDSSCPFDDLHEDDSRSYGSVDLDCSVIGDGDLSTIYEEATCSHSVSF